MRDPMKDGALEAVGEKVARAKPQAMEIERDLVAAAMEDARVPRARRLAVRHRRTTALAWIALVVVVVGTAWIVQRRGEPGRLLALAEAATVAMPSHEVVSVYEGEGKLLEKAEVWMGPEGDEYAEVWSSGHGQQLSLARKRENIQWSWDVTKREYELNWLASGMSGREAETSAAAERAVRKAGGIDMGGVQLGLLQGLAIAQMRASGGKLSVHESRGELAGRDVRVIDIATAPPAQGGRSTAMVASFYVAADGSRLVRQVTRFVGADRRSATVDIWPIEYDAKAPASMFEFRIPEGATVVFEGRKISPVWEKMDDAEKQQIRETVLGLGKAWAAGDAEGFCQHFDFSAGLEYGVKGKFTADQMRQNWVDMVRSRVGQWREDRIFFDYAFGTARPPGEALAFWSIYPGPPAHGDHWVAYRARPSVEPGIMVLARERVVDRNGAVMEHGTHMFLRKIAGQYKVILWSPPFG